MQAYASTSKTTKTKHVIWHRYYSWRPTHFDLLKGKFARAYPKLRRVLLEINGVIIRIEFAIIHRQVLHTNPELISRESSIQLAGARIAHLGKRQYRRGVKGQRRRFVLLGLLQLVILAITG